MVAKKFSLLILSLLLVLLTLGAVSAIDSDSMDLAADGGYSAVAINSDDSADISVSEINNVKKSEEENVVSSDIGANVNSVSTIGNTHSISESNYSKYFNSKGQVNTSIIKKNDVLDLSGNFKNKKFVINLPVTITSSSNTAKLVNSYVNFNSGSSGSTISNIIFNMTIDNNTCIKLTNVDSITVSNNKICSNGTASYGIYLINAHNCIISNNDLTTERSKTSVEKGILKGCPSPILLDGSNNNRILNNAIKTQDANGIYLCSYLTYQIGGSNNIIVGNDIQSTLDLPSSFCYAISVMANNSIVANNTISNVYKGIDAPGCNNIISDNILNNIHGVYSMGTKPEQGSDCAIDASGLNNTVKNNKISNSIINANGQYINAGHNAKIMGNVIEINDNELNNGAGIKITGSNCLVYDNVIAVNGIGIKTHSEGERKEIFILNNDITSKDKGIELKGISSSKLLDNVYVSFNNINTLNDVAINISKNIGNNSVVSNNNVNGKNIIVANNTKDTYCCVVTEDNFDEYFEKDGSLYQPNFDKFEPGSIIFFMGDFSSKYAIMIRDSINLIGFNATFKDTSFIINEVNDGVTIKNINIINDDTSRINKWGIYVYGSNNVNLTGNNVLVNDAESSLAVFIDESNNVIVKDNSISAIGDFLTFAVFIEDSTNVIVDSNVIYANGTATLTACDSDSTCTGCIGGVCAGSVCAGGVCAGSVCAGSVCAGGVCTGGVCAGDVCAGTYCNGVHEIYGVFKTYGVLATNSSKNTISNNKITVGSKITDDVIPFNQSVNAISGLYIHYNSNNNMVKGNKITVVGKDPFAYGMGVVGDNGTEDSRLVSKGNTFDSNDVYVKSSYYVSGMNVAHNTTNTKVVNNKFTLRANNTAGIVVEDSSKSNNISGNSIDDGSTSITASSFTKYYGDSKKLTITLKNSLGNVVSGQKVSITIAGKTYSATTNSKGQASFAIDVAKGSYTTTIKYAGSADLKASSKKITIKVVKPTMKASSLKVKRNKYLSVTFKSYNGKAIKKTKVTFKLKGKTYTVTTDSKGVAKLKLTVKKGTYKIVTGFKSATTYGKTTSTFKVKVY